MTQSEYRYCYPNYLVQLFAPIDQRDHRTQHRNRIRPSAPLDHCSSSRSFAVAASTIWNELQWQFRAIEVHVQESNKETFHRTILIVIPQFTVSHTFVIISKIKLCLNKINNNNNNSCYPYCYGVIRSDINNGQ